MLGEKGHYIVFRLGKADLPPVNEHPPCVVIDQQRLRSECAAGELAAVGPVLIIPQNHADARQQLRRAEGLCHIVVCACVQRQNLVLVVVSRGQHDDRGQ